MVNVRYVSANWPGGEKGPIGEVKDDGGLYLNADHPWVRRATAAQDTGALLPVAAALAAAAQSASATEEGEFLDDRARDDVADFAWRYGRLLAAEVE